MPVQVYTTIRNVKANLITNQIKNKSARYAHKLSCILHTSKLRSNPLPITKLVDYHEKALLKQKMYAS